MPAPDDDDETDSIPIDEWPPRPDDPAEAAPAAAGSVSFIQDSIRDGLILE